MGTLSVERHTAGLIEVTEDFAAITAGIDPGRRVPTCPDWTLHDLVEHVGNAHHWTSELVRSRTTDFPSHPRPSARIDPAMWTPWLREGAASMADATEATGPGTVVWTFLGPLPAAFWVRRILHDTLVHLADAAVTADRPFTVPRDLAADTLGEGLELLTHPAVARVNPARHAELSGNGETLLLRADDVEDGWLITRTPDGPAWRRGDAGADVVLSGPVADVLRVFSRRLPPDDPAVKVTGERALLDHWLAHTAFA
ncbi:maleylpyruvate isomerase family mycothiol-dependent enzyme [Spirillospora sp. CA-294931]|uniref:maleylpyruvate isomerase family mycothiol-dependent enzyme n=1 Tax=Spirillospora sp. CA-294931 TaxID=3240042 RepID=UPI003D9014CC